MTIFPPPSRGPRTTGIPGPGSVTSLAVQEFAAMSLRPGLPRLVAGPDSTLPGSDYSDEERAFLAAIEG